jgi:hypothetical protein
MLGVTVIGSLAAPRNGRRGDIQLGEITASDRDTFEGLTQFSWSDEP